MIITCPECQIRFLLNSSLIGVGGRRVKCGKCGHIWHQDPELEPTPGDTETPVTSPPEEEFAAPEEEQEPHNDPTESAAPGTQLSTPEKQVEISHPGEIRALRPGSNLPALPRKRSKGLILGWVLLVAIITGIPTGGYFYKNEILEIWPISERLYLKLGFDIHEAAPNLDFGETKTELQNENGVFNLLVSGSVVNLGGRSGEVPPFDIVLRDGEKREIKRVRHEIPIARLSAGGQYRFKLTIENVPSETRILEPVFIPTEPE